jgi:hypothetical protein
VHQVKALAEGDAPAAAGFAPVLAQSITIVNFAGEAVRLIEDVRLGEEDRSIGLLGSGRDFGAEALARADEGAVGKDIGPLIRPIG